MDNILQRNYIFAEVFGLQPATLNLQGENFAIFKFEQNENRVKRKWDWWLSEKL